MRHTPTAIDVTGVGLICSVGHDALTACAAIRAGISRPSELAGSSAYDLAGAVKTPVVGHSVAKITDGFVGTARWLQLATRAFDDLVKQAGLPPPQDRAFWSTTALQIFVPDVRHERFAHDPRTQLQSIRATFQDPLVRRLPSTLRADAIFLQPADRIGIALLAESWRKLLDQHRVARMVVLAVDSYACPYTIDWLGFVGRLKGDLNPVGLMPGEAGAALLLEPSGKRAKGERPAWARITAVATGLDTSLDDPDAPARGRVLADVLRALALPGTGDLHLDLNGEVWRAREYGNAMVHLAPNGLGDVRLHHWAAEIGDTGAVAPVVGTVLASRSLQRGYARGNQAVVAWSAESGEIGGLALGRPEGG